MKQSGNIIGVKGEKKVKVEHVYLITYDLYDSKEDRLHTGCKNYFGGNTEQEAIDKLFKQWNCNVIITKIVRFDRVEEKEIDNSDLPIYQKTNKTKGEKE